MKTTEPIRQVITKKQFGQMFNIKSYNAYDRLYKQYLFLAGKKENMTLTNIDIQKVES
jgi:hypothetical protein